jgi:hypothetical protein
MHGSVAFQHCALPLLLLAVFSAPGGVASAAAGDPSRHTLGVEFAHMSPGSPMESATGLGIRYARGLGEGAAGGAGPWRLAGTVGQVKPERRETDRSRDGELDLLHLRLGLERRLLAAEGWSLWAGGGLDYFDADAKGTYASDPILGIRNHYEADSGVGFHAGVSAGYRMGERWELLLSLVYLSAELDGTFRFVIEDVPSASSDVKFDLSGPRFGAGIAYRF